MFILQKRKKFKNNYLSFCLKKLERRQANQTKVSRKKNLVRNQQNRKWTNMENQPNQKLGPRKLIKLVNPWLQESKKRRNYTC